eukprot:176194-Rhodomonas_salina.2
MRLFERKSHLPLAGALRREAGGGAQELRESLEEANALVRRRALPSEHLLPALPSRIASPPPALARHNISLCPRTSTPHCFHTNASHRDSELSRRPRTGARAEGDDGAAAARGAQVQEGG